MFVGGCTLDMAERVAEADLRTLGSLVDKNLLRRSTERFWMLETIREFALERLEASGEALTIRDRHLDAMIALVEEAYAERFTAASRWSPIVDAERDNIRGALEHAAASRPRDEVRLTGAAAFYWLDRGLGPELRDRLTRIVQGYRERDGYRARALTHLGEALGDIGEDREALTFLDEAVELWAELEDPLGEASALVGVGLCTVALGETEAARSAFERGIELSRTAGGSELLTAELVAGLCQVLISSGQTEEAERAATDLLEIASRHGAERTGLWALIYLADRALIDGEFDEAERRYLRALEQARRERIDIQLPARVLGVAMTAAALGDLERAVRLAAAARARLKELGLTVSSFYWDQLQRWFLDGARALLDPDVAAEAERKGAAADLEAVIEELLGDPSEDTSPST